MVQWKVELVEEIPNYGRPWETNNAILDEDDNDASQTIDEMFDESDDIGGHDSFFDALNQSSEDYFTPAIP
jgi:hypothetical protein